MSTFSWSVRVYWEDTDGGGVVYYANYLKYLERARTEWLRSLGFSQRALAQDPGIVDDELIVSCDAKIDGAASISFEQRVSRYAVDAAEGAETLAVARAQIVCVDARTFKPKRLPPLIKNALGAPELK